MDETALYEINIGQNIIEIELPGGTRGERGEKGDKGDTGEQGPQGIQGEPGPKGDKGDKGDPGVAGERGETGPANTLSIGTVTRGAEASAEITGEAPNQTLNLVLPQGIKGDTGDTGPQGPKGDKGDKGDTGDTGPKGDTGDTGPQGLKGDKGDKGDAGDDGFSPTVTSSKSGKTTTLTITDANGTSTATILDGEDGPTYTAGSGIDITNNVISNTQTSAQWGNITGTLSNQTDLQTALSSKQDTLVSGTNIKTINNLSILGSGNISIQGGSGSISDGPLVVDSIRTKNMFDKTTYFQGYIDTSNSKIVYDNPPQDRFCGYVKIKPNTTYTISKQAGYSFRIATTKNAPRDGATYNTTQANHTGTSMTITTGATDNYLVVFYYGASNGDTGGYLSMASTVQVEESSTATSYSAYQGLDTTKLSDSNIVVGSIRTKNMFDKNSLIAGYRFDTDGALFADGFYSATDYIEVKPSTTYTYTRPKTRGFQCICLYDSSKTFISKTSFGKVEIYTFTTTSATQYVRIAEITSDLSANIQLEEGSTATTYTPYQELNPYVFDTGWVDLSSYVNTTNFTIRPGLTPKARIIGKTVYLKGSVYCSTAPNAIRSNLLNDIPTQFRPPESGINGAGVRDDGCVPYKIYYESGNISVREGSNIPTTLYDGGYSLSNLGPYLID